MTTADSTPTLPVIDLSPFVPDDEQANASIAGQIQSACAEIGFFYVRGHGVSAEKTARLQRVITELFRLPHDSKTALSVRPGDYRGYIPFAAFGDNEASDVPDHYEGYKLHREVSANDPIRAHCQLYAPNRWPAQVSGFRHAVLDYWNEMDVLAEKLMRLFARALGLEECCLHEHFVDALTNMTLLHYPPLTAAHTGPGIHPHRDIDAFTLLLPAEKPGLEVRDREHRWRAVEPLDDAMLVNIGNMLELWSGGRFISTPHRVTNPPDEGRFSFPYFAIPRYDVLLTPLIPRIDGYEVEPVLAGVAASELYMTNWKTERSQKRGIDVGKVSELEER